jgi:hypothetical protein
MAQHKHPHGARMDLASMRRLGVRSLDVQCLNHRCRHQVVFDVDSYPAETLVQSFGPKMVCAQCGFIGADPRPNWQEMPIMTTKLRED